MAVEMSNTQLKFPTPVFTEADGVTVVPLSQLTLAYTTSDATVCNWEMRKADGSVGDATDAGTMAATSQGPLGSCVMTVTATNPDGTTDALNADVTVTLSPSHDAVGGSLGFGDPVEKI